MLDLIAWIETGEWRDGDAACQPLRDFAMRRLDSRWRRVKQGGKALAGLDAEQRHRLRIDVKKLRYAVEFLSTLQRGESRASAEQDFLAALEEMQEQLGELNDAETARGLLERLLGDERNAVAMIGKAERRLAKAGSERDRVSAADEAYGRLKAVGPFWR